MFKKWEDPAVCVLIHPTAFDTNPGWAANVQRLTEKGELSRHYIRFAATQSAHLQSLIAGATPSTRWRVIAKKEKYILVRVDFINPPLLDEAA